MQWYDTVVSRGSTSEICLARLRAEVDGALATGALPPEAEVIVAEQGDIVRVYANEAARGSLPILAGLALRTSAGRPGAATGASLVAPRRHAAALDRDDERTTESEPG